MNTNEHINEFMNINEIMTISYITLVDNCKSNPPATAKHIGGHMLGYTARPG
jgi:hypothetical protein